MARPKKVYLGSDGTPMVNVFIPNFPESLRIEIQDYGNANQLKDFRASAIHLIEKGLGKRG